MTGGERQIALRFHEYFDGRRYGATAAVAEDDDDLQTAAEMFDGVLQAAEHLLTEAIAGDTDYEKIVGALIEYEFDRNPRIRTAEHGREGPLLWTCGVARPESKVVRVHVDDPGYSSAFGGQVSD